MIEDALNVGTPFLEALDFMFVGTPVPFCEQSPYIAVEAHALTSDTARPWETKANTSLKGNTGRIVHNAPTKGKLILHFIKPGDEKPFDTWYENKTGTFLPGYYQVRFFNYTLEDKVPVVKGKDTYLKTGAVNISATTSWEVVTVSDKPVHKDTGPKMLILPIGKYKVKLKSGHTEVEVTEGEITEL